MWEWAASRFGLELQPVKAAPGRAGLMRSLKFAAASPSPILAHAQCFAQQARQLQVLPAHRGNCSIPTSISTAS